MNVSNALARRINKKIKENENLTEMDIKKKDINQKIEKAPDFVEGLCRLLSGITAHLSSTVVSAPLAHVLIVKGSRFQFSHEFGNLLLTQIIDC